jgi:hypothetical protein
MKKYKHPVKRERFWAVIMESCYVPGIKFPEQLCFTWDYIHPKDTRKERTVRVWAIYPKKKDALSDAKFRGLSYVEEIWIMRE